MFAKLAVLNILKHGKRSVVVFLGVALAVLVLSLVGGVVRGLTDTVLSSIVPTAGHVVIADARSKDATNPLDLKFLVPDADHLLAQLHDERITLAEPVLTFGALLVEPVGTDSKKDARNLGMIGQGVNPDTHFLANVRAGITEGAFLPGGQGIALSHRAAKLLGVKMGGTVMVLTTDRGNNPWYQELPITGVFDSGSETVDLTTFVVSQQTARTLVDADGMTREFRFLVKDQDTAPAVAAALQAQLQALGYGADQLRVEPWQVSFSSLLTILQFLNVLTFIIRVFFVVVAGSVITNSILMTVFERTREYGTLRAIGLKRRQLRAMILTEGLVLGAAGAVAALVVGIPAVLLLSQVGLDLGNATESLGFASKIFPALSPVDVGFNALFGTLIAVFASAYAARVSSRLTVTEALTHT
jgi:ABC-type lipoprotein release transport system permease subunit